MTAWYNENDPKAAAWLRELIKEGHIAKGIVDERSIEDVTPDELTGFAQCHFFAGIGGWSYALRLAGWPDDRPVWTGSCPCQPFSAAGKRGGFADERHLWPAWHWLIRQCRPSIVFGEQVANALPWFDLVSTDLEGEGYACGAAIMGAHSVGAPHIRQRIYWMAKSMRESSERRARSLSRAQAALSGARQLNGNSADRLADGGEAGELAFAESEQLHRGGDSGRWGGEPADNGELGYTNKPRSQGFIECRDGADKRAPWASSMALHCTDGKSRPVEPGTFPLAHGVPGRVGLLRGYGNAIVPQVAAAFIEACS